MSLNTQVGLVWLVVVMFGMNACTRFVSLPSNLRADAQQMEYGTASFTVRGPRGRWVTDSAIRVRGLKIHRTCESPYDAYLLGGVVAAYVDYGWYRTPLGGEQIRFYRIVKVQFVTDYPESVSDNDACITVTSYPLRSRDSSAAAGEDTLGFFQTVQRYVRKLAPSPCLSHGFWGAHVSDGVGRLQELRVGERTFYYFARVSERDSTKLCEDHGVELLYAAQGKVFAVYASSPGILDDALPVAESLTPRE